MAHKEKPDHYLDIRMPAGWFRNAKLEGIDAHAGYPHHF
jgi:hypothetical protein